MRETALGLDALGEFRFEPDAFAAQPLARVGVAAAPDGVHVVGAALPGADARREGSGEGIALSTGHHVAELVAA
jgi:anaerobic glycerol-3-phosphate dehydrogenase